MSAHLTEWLHLLIKLGHLIAGIAWIGSSFFFMWMDSNLEAPPEEQKEEVEGKLWMVHSGGFYLVEKKFIQPGWIPDNLHWFKWEATLTWVTGFFLLGVVYYMGGAVYTIKPDSGLTPVMAMGIGLGLLVVGWTLYDLMWKYLFADKTALGSVVSFALVIAAAFGLSHVFSGRGMFIHIGALLGTCMVANVWMRILPAQQQMLDATARNEKADFSLGERAKQRSVHNNYMTFPVLFIMISNHIPSTYGHTYNWLILAGLALCGAGVRHFMNTKTPFSKFALATSVAGVVGLFFYTAPRTAPAVAQTNGTPAQTVSFSEVNTIIQNRCATCHSANPTDDVFKVAPSGAMYDTPEEIKKYVPKIKARAVDSKTMPLGNKTQMTDKEREILGLWIAQGAPLD